MEKLALTLPGSTTPITSLVKTGKDQAIPSADLGGVISATLDVVFLIASVLMLVWMLWGIFQYIFAGGDKERLAKARARITWAIVGFSIVLLAFTVQRYIKEIFPPNTATPLTPVTTSAPAPVIGPP